MAAGYCLLVAACCLSAASRGVGAQAPVSGEELVRTLGCPACHTGLARPVATRDIGPPLGDAGVRRAAASLFAYLASVPGSRPAEGRPRMPDFRLDEGERLALALFLAMEPAGSSARSREDDPGAIAAFERARKAHPRIDRGVGERIFVVLNCAGCHAHPTVTAATNGPDLSGEGSRAKAAWLRTFLARPHPIRPFGSPPRSGGRMPDFRLSERETDAIHAYLIARRQPLAPFTPRRLSPFATAKVESLLRDQLPCLGCHSLGGEGGRIGPDLSAARDRLQASYVLAMIADPQHVVPRSIMPKTVMLAATQELVASYLALRTPSGPPPPYLTLVGTSTDASSSGGDGRALYARYCAHCHGANGKGDGWNAPFVGARPTAHASAGEMSARPDAVLYDGIYAGGRVLNRSNRMPGFGHTLTREQIWSLVRFIRELCHCEGPAWSRDGR